MKERELRQLGGRITRLENELVDLRRRFDRLTGQAAAPESRPEGGPVTRPEDGEGARRPVSSGLTERLRVRWSGFRQGAGEDLELLFGGNILGKIGLSALILASAWFIKLAFDNRWINESGRIYTGLIIGFLICGVGLFLAARKFRLLPPAVFGAGAAILYITVFGAHYFYNLLGLTETFVALVALSAVLTYLALRADSQLLYLFSVAGAFLAPVLLSTGENSYGFLFSYLSLFNLAFLTVSFFRPWRTSPYFILGGNALIYGVWAGEHLGHSSFPIPFLYLTLLFVVFAVREAWVVPVRGRRTSPDGMILLFFATVFYFFAGRALCAQYHSDFTSHFFLFGAGISLAQFQLHEIGRSSLRADSGKIADRGTLLLQSLILLTFLVWIFAALTDYFSGSWLTMSWIVLAGVVAIMAARFGSLPLTVSGVVLWLVALFRLYFLEPGPLDFTLIWNGRFALFCCATLLLAGAYLIRRPPFHRALGGYIYVAMFTLILGSLKENHDLVTDAHYRNLGYSYVIALYAAVFLLIGFLKHIRLLRLSGIVLAGVVVLKLFLYDIWTMSKLVRIIAGFTLGVALVVLSIFYQRFRARLFNKT